MPYKRTGAMKISDHHVRSPLLNIEKVCQTCHRWSEEEPRSRVHMIQDRTYQLRNIAMEATLQLTPQIGAAVKRDGTSERVQEAARVLALAINYARLGHAALNGDALPTIGGPRRPPEQVVSPPRLAPIIDAHVLTSVA